MSRGKKMVDLCKELNANTLNPGTIYDCVLAETPLISPINIETGTGEQAVANGNFKDNNIISDSENSEFLSPVVFPENVNNLESFPSEMRLEISTAHNFFVTQVENSSDVNQSLETEITENTSELYCKYNVSSLYQLRENSNTLKPNLSTDSDAIIEFEQDLLQTCISLGTTADSLSTQMTKNTDARNYFVNEDPEATEVDDPDWEPNLLDKSMDIGEEQSDGPVNDENEAPETNNQILDQQKRCTRKKVAEPKEWEKNKNKALRMVGTEYLAYQKTKDGNSKQKIVRSARTLQVGCTSMGFCAKSLKRNCSQFSEQNRTDVFNSFWKMTWQQKKMYVLAMVLYLPKKRCYVEGPSRRSGSYVYNLRLENERLQVCKRTFLSTLDLKEKMVQNWVLQSVKNHGFAETPEERNIQKTENRNRSPFVMKSKAELDFLKNFLETLAKMESHYCRKDTKKQYLQYPFKTKVDVYKLYKTECQKENRSPLSIFTFNKIFDELNLSIYVPRKDQCDICCQYKVKQLSEDEYTIRIKNKEDAQNEKRKDKERAIRGECYTFTMDVMAVKLCPVIEASALYYKTRMQIHIFTIYNLATHECVNYLWNESQADLQASVFVSCIIKHLEKFCLADKKNIILFSDGCGYQNRNSILSNALSFFSTKHNMIIEQKWLEKGHTQMECDSTNALIERKLKGRQITLPSQYINIIREARQKPFPLIAEYLDHDFFLNYNDPQITRFDSIRPGKAKLDPTVSNLRCLRYLTDGNITYKVNFSAEFQDLIQRVKKPLVQPDLVLKPLFTKRLSIKESKWRHLQELKKVMDKEVHSFYDNLPYKPEKTGKKDDIFTNNQKVPIMKKSQKPNKDLTKTKIIKTKKNETKVNVKKKASKK